MPDLRHDWTNAEIEAFYNLPFGDLLSQAHQVHSDYFNPNEIQISTLLSVKTGACPEDCGYCPQSVHHHVDLEPEHLIDIDSVIESAQQAKNQGATRFCMGAAWRNPTDRNLDKIATMVEAVHNLGLETCVTLGMLKPHQAVALKQAGLDYYNHNLDTSPAFYEKVITTRTYQDRLDTLTHVRDAGLKICSGGIIGMGESRKDRSGLLQQLANLPKHPESVPINYLVQVEGTPLYGTPPLDPLEFVRTIAVARLLMPESYVRLSAGRSDMSDELQALCFFAGANSIFYGEKLLTTQNAQLEKDQALFTRLGLRPEKKDHQNRETASA